MTKTERSFFAKLAKECCVDLTMTDSFVRFSWAQTALEFHGEQLKDTNRIERLVMITFGPVLR